MQARQTSRVRTNADGTCKNMRGFRWDVHVDDISQGGCRVDDPRHGLELGAHIQLIIAETGPYTAEVAWRQGDRVGLEFVSTLDPQVFALMASGEWEQAQELERDGGGPAAPIRYAVRRIM
ncbi:MAG: PilZ domain-containing protein [Erythrobacter sp.]|nr:PilZ domain-containing protein [Erythrobacter sp.]